MKKGITPIIAIIVLLLITIALAGTAWTFLSQYIRATAGKNLQMIDSYCLGGTTAVVVMKSVGTDTINPGSCGTIGSMGSDQTTYTCGDIVITRTDGGDLDEAYLDKTSPIKPQELLTFKDENCTVSGTIKTCTYRFITGNMGPVQGVVTCSG